MLRSHGGSDDAVVVKVNSSGAALLWSTYLGGSSSDFAYDLALGKNGQIFLTGITTSSNLPTMNPLQANLKGNANSFVTKLKADGSALEYSTYLGGIATDGFFSLALDSADNAYVTGYTYSNDFPQVDPAQSYSFAPYYNSYYHVVAAKLNATGSALVFATYLGGTGQEAGYGIAVDARNQVYLTGFTSSRLLMNFSLLQGLPMTPLLSSWGSKRM